MHVLVLCSIVFPDGRGAGGIPCAAMADWRIPGHCYSGLGKRLTGAEQTDGVTGGGGVCLDADVTGKVGRDCLCSSSSPVTPATCPHRGAMLGASVTGQVVCTDPLQTRTQTCGLGMVSLSLDFSKQNVSPHGWKP